ncbi:hypothetical protein SKAU_G00320800 [Synaphobranchus kaupii]|uniref:Macro domain-containing protein n=1 Tax=Synaphobranchus kaupii TaxID=118154 RepID=A0A9Q1IJI9_SYNKA|nr:hypothetical protein SKAU_G00320800 [Synaphobranchus kaupii]
MEDYPYAVTVAGEWGPNPPKSLKNKLQIYFQSKNKSGGGDCQVEFTGGAATVSFKSKDVRERVLEKEDHELAVENGKVKLRPLRQEENREEAVHGAEVEDIKPAESGVQEEMHSDSAELSQARAVLLENVPEKLSREVLGMMVESICNVTEEEFSLEMIRDMNTAVVTFNKPSAAERFLSKCSGHSRFQQYQLQGRVLEPTCSVRVENLPPLAVEDLLELYFEKERQGGGRVAGITMIPEEQAAIITFQDPKVAENVLQRKHHICKALVSVYPYQQALGTALYGTDRPEWKLPEAFTENLHPALGNFLLQECQLAAISAQMQAQFCQVEFSTEHAKLRPMPGLLKQKDLTANRIEGWRGEASQAFRSIVARYRCFECPVSASVWKAAETEMRQAVGEDAVLLPNLSNGVVAIAGLAKDVDRIQKEVEELVQRAANQLEWERNGVSEEMVVSPGLYSILQKAGLQSIFTQRYPALSITYRSDTQSLVLSSLPTEVITVKNWVLEKKLEMKQRPLDLEPELSTADIEEISQNKGVQEEIQSESADLSQATAVLVENVPEKLSREVLGMMVESICNVTEEEFSLEMIRDMNTAVVTFSQPSAAERFLSKCSDHSRFQQYLLQGRVLEPTCSVRVDNLPPLAEEELLELYFEKERQGGGRVAGITMIPEEQAAIITFQDPKVAENVLQRKHHICKALVSVYPYQQALGTALYGTDRPEWKLPEAFTENLHPALGNFLLQESQLTGISAQMQAQFCQVEFSTEHAKLRPLPGLLKQKGLMANRIEGWRGEASQAFRSIVARYRCFECPVSASVWKAAETEIRQVVSEDAVLLPNLPNGVVAIAGLAKDVDRIQKEVEELVQRAAHQLERERDGVSEEMVMSPGMHSILQQAGLQSIFTQRYPALSMTYRSDTQSLILSGLSTEVFAVKLWVLEKKLASRNMEEEDKPMRHKQEEEEDGHAVSCRVQMDNGVLVTVSKADLAHFVADAVVNAANERLQHYGGLSAALLMAAGQKLQEDSDAYVRTNGRLRSGDAAITQAGRLPCKYVIHAVGPYYSSANQSRCVQQLAHAVSQSLDLAEKHGCTSIAIPAISSGIFGFPLKLCAETIAKAVWEHCVDNRSSRASLAKIHLVSNDDKTVQAMTQAVQTVFADVQLQILSQRRRTKKTTLQAAKWNSPFERQWSSADQSWDKPSQHRGGLETLHTERRQEKNTPQAAGWSSPSERQWSSADQSRDKPSEGMRQIQKSFWKMSQEK